MNRATILAVDVPGYSLLISSDEVDALARAITTPIIGRREAGSRIG
jgi:hypothetical protein